MKRWLVIGSALVLLVAAATLGGWYLNRDDSPTSDGSPGADSSSSTSADAKPETTVPAADVRKAPDPALQHFYDQELTWRECKKARECATLRVPVNYAEPEGESIQLALLKVPAEGERQGSLVVNPGGPGAPGTNYADYGSMVFRKPLLEAFDIVGFDPRGTGDSAPVDCLSDADLDTYLSGDPDPETKADIAEWVGEMRDFARGCAAKSGDLVNHVSTIEAARDMDVLRAALGEEKLTYLGASYGTKLGATYASLFPDRVGRLVLDGAVDPTIDFKQMSLEQAGGFETALRAYVQNCLDSTDNCFLGDTVDEGLATIKQLLDDIEKEPLSTSDGDRQLTIGNAFYGVVTPLYMRENWFMLSTALKGALDGDGTQLLMMADLYASRGADGYDDNSIEANYVINCLDDPSSIKPGEVKSVIPEFEKVSPTFGRVFAWGTTGCRWSKGRTTEEPLEISGRGADPILVVGTTRDPATPMKWAESLAAQLDSGVLLTREGDGHTAYNSGNECIDDAIEGYLLDGAVPEDGKTC